MKYFSLKTFLLGSGALALILSACSQTNTSQGYNAPIPGNYASAGNVMSGLSPQTQQMMMADMQANPGNYRQQQGETYDAYVTRINSYAYRWMTPEEYRNREYRYAVSNAAIQQAVSMGLVEARANNMMWDEAVKTERAQAQIWGSRADVQSSKRSINRDKVRTYSDTTRGISDTVGGVSDTFRNTKSMIDNFTSIFD